MATPKEEYFDAYKEHSTTLRTWLVAYGIGAPVLFMTNDKLVDRFSHAADSKLIAGLFLTGVVLQVLLAVMNKAVNWASYFAEGHEERKKEWCFKFACWFCDQFWVDMLLDIASLGFFAVATWKSFALFMSGHAVG